MKNLDLVELGNNIRAERKAQNLSQECLAEMAEISVTSLKNIESGKSDLRLGTLFKIVESLDTSLINLLPRKYFDNPGSDVWALAFISDFSHLSEKKQSEVRPIVDGVMRMANPN